MDGGAALHVVLHEAPQSSVDNALAEIVQLPEVRGPPVGPARRLGPRRRRARLGMSTGLHLRQTRYKRAHGMSR